MSGGVVAVDIDGTVDGGTEVGGEGEGDGVGFCVCEEVTGGKSDEVGDDIGDDGAEMLTLLAAVGDDLKKKNKTRKTLSGD